MQIIKDRQIVEDNWLHLDDEAELVVGDVTVSITRWQAEHETLVKHNGGLGLRLSGSDPLEEIIPDLASFSLIVLIFPVFVDGRCYSFARLLRDRYGYEGEIRAQGDILYDQLFYMTQCGINSFEMANIGNITEVMSAFDDFSESYQATVLKPEPLYRRR
ncbi:MAG: oxidoreductase [Methylophaga sp.]|nr:MAG: oxidoreductase [Methylophaga sp.]